MLGAAGRGASSSSALLLCQVSFSGWSGSEVVSLELIEWFVARGWRVDLVTTKYAAPLSDATAHLVESGALRVFSLHTSGELDANDYSLIWVNQSLLPSSIIDQLAREAMTTPMIWHHMSSFQVLGMPLMYEVEDALASIITCIAPVARERLRDYGFGAHEIEIFDNPAPDEFVEAALPSARTSPRSLLVVSNHPPEELRRAADILSSRGVEVVFAGLADGYGRITPETIAAHDAVITIGKTTQYALTMGVPVYSYDHFGGGGWLTQANLDQEWRGNFAGRIERRVLDAQQLADELEQGFGEAQLFARGAREVHAQRWSLTRQLDALLTDPRLEPGPRTLDPRQARLAALHCAMRDELWGALRRAEADVARMTLAQQPREAQLVLEPGNPFGEFYSDLFRGLTHSRRRTLARRPGVLERFAVPTRRGEHVEVAPPLTGSPYRRYVMDLDAGNYASVTLPVWSAGLPGDLIGIEVVDPRGSIVLHSVAALPRSDDPEHVTLDAHDLRVQASGPHEIRVFARTRQPAFVLEAVRRPLLGFGRPIIRPLIEWRLLPRQ